ncbi:MAG: dehydrogenase [Gammaproteobacteria bacterium]|nr:MAG: dehydrogenase [Gammaproteobacteria bacterium]
MIELETIQQQVLDAKQLRIFAGKSQFENPKSAPSVALLDMTQYAGVIEYYPEELVITVKAGTTIKHLNEILVENNQATSFVLPDNEKSTIGGAYAMGNPDLRDAVLGIKIIDGRGRLLSFGGQVMKNVAGYDVARLLAGSKGKMAIICEISFKIIPLNYAQKIACLKNIDQPIPIKTKKLSTLKIQIEQGIKNIFDPLGKFI